MERVLAGVTDENPLWLTVHQRLCNQLAEAIDAASSAKAADRPGSMAHAAGAIEALLAAHNNLIADAQIARARQLARKPAQPATRPSA